MKHLNRVALLAAGSAVVPTPRAVFAAPRADGEDPRELLAQLNRAFAEFREKNDAALKGKADVVLSEQVDRINQGMTELTASLNEQASTIAALRLGGGGGTQTSPEAAAHAEAFGSWFRRGHEPEGGMRDFEVRAALNTQSDPDGGYVVPETMDGEISRVLGTVSVVRQVARVIQIGTGSYSKLVNQGGANSGWVGEEEGRPETKGPRLVAVTIPVHEIYANPAATQTLLDDARVDIAAWLADEVSIEFAEQEGEAFVSGDGNKKPRGLMSYTKVANASYAWGKVGYVASGAASTFPAASTSVSPADPLISLYYALKSGYRAAASWLMSDAVMETVRKFKTAEGAYIWAPPSGTAEIATILGKPVRNDDNFDAIGAGKFPIAFGDFRRAYTVVDRFGTRILRDPYTNKPYVHFYTTKRVGGGVTNFEAYKVLKIAES